MDNALYELVRRLNVPPSGIKMPPAGMIVAVSIRLRPDAYMHLTHAGQVWINDDHIGHATEETQQVLLDAAIGQALKAIPGLELQIANHATRQIPGVDF
jgi:hypothetical protein